MSGSGREPGTPPPPAPRGPSLVDSVSVAPSRILVVEDSRTQADWLRQVLEREGYAVTVAQDGREAIRRVRSEPPDLVLLDMILPDMNGLDVLRVIKARSEEQFIPVILLSVRSDLDSRVTGLRLGADDFLAKPFADAEIQARAAAMLRIKSLQDQLRAALEMVCDKVAAEAENRRLLATLRAGDALRGRPTGEA